MEWRMISINKDHESKAIQYINQFNYLGLSKDRTNTFLLAMASSDGTRIEVTNKMQYIRDGYVNNNSETKALLLCAALSQIDEENITNQLNIDNISTICEEMANDGFYNLDTELRRREKSQEELIEELDLQYKKLVENY